MRTLLVIAWVLGLAGLAAAADLGSQAPLKTPRSHPENVPNPHRQGGDTIATALVIPSLPYADTGTTSGFTNDYDETCPYGASTSPDVVYAYTPAATGSVTIDLCGSAYDTKVYVYASDMSLVACNDDFYFGEPCGAYVSKLEDVVLAPGLTYAIVVDGYSGAFGDYVLAVDGYQPCSLACPDGGVPEGEPPLVPNYHDDWNGGCQSMPNYPFQAIGADVDGRRIFCGVSGWYPIQGGHSRDQDYLILQMGPAGAIEITVDAESPIYIFELGPQDCSSIGVLQQATGGPCLEAAMTITGYDPGAPVWFWAAPTVFWPPSGDVYMFDYVLWLDGLDPGPIATEPATWGTVKALFK